MLRIHLHDEVYTKIDDADERLVAGFDWRTLTPPSSYTSYVHAWNGQMSVLMHRLIAGAGPKQQVDHWDRDGLNNQRLNLRLATSQQNQANQRRNMRAERTSKYKGVYWDKDRNRWAATIHANYKTRALGRYLTEEEAARAYDEAATTEWGRFARLNFPVETGLIALVDLGKR